MRCATQLRSATSAGKCPCWAGRCQNRQPDLQDELSAVINMHPSRWWLSRKGNAMTSVSWRWLARVILPLFLTVAAAAQGQGPWDWKVTDNPKSQPLENVTVSVIVTNDSSNAVVVRILNAQCQPAGDTTVPANSTSGSISIPSGCTAWVVNSAGNASGTYKHG